MAGGSPPGQWGVLPRLHEGWGTCWLGRVVVPMFAPVALFSNSKHQVDASPLQQLHALTHLLGKYLLSTCFVAVLVLSPRGYTAGNAVEVSALTEAEHLEGYKKANREPGERGAGGKYRRWSVSPSEEVTFELRLKG